MFMDATKDVHAQSVDLQSNLRMCLDHGFGAIITAKKEVDYRNAIIFIHNGVELLMKLYLRNKDKYLIYNKLDYTMFLHERSDLIQELPKAIERNTINFSECISVLKYFSKATQKYEKDLFDLNDLRNSRVHYEYTSDWAYTKKLLIVYVYTFVGRVSRELSLELKEFLDEKYITALNKMRKSIRNETEHNLQVAIEIAKKHYNQELTEDERAQKTLTESYTIKGHDRLVTCPACNNNALLKMKATTTMERTVDFYILTVSLVLNELQCHHCSLYITERDQLRVIFGYLEKTISRQRFIRKGDNDCDDCADDDCADCADYDCDDCADSDCW